jgi:hypothetical protein
MSKVIKVVFHFFDEKDGNIEFPKRWKEQSSKRSTHILHLFFCVSN